MNKFKIMLVLICIAVTNMQATIYYVSATGNNGNSGLSADQPWRTLTYASTIANAGDVVYVKAGDYGNEKVVFSKSGTAGSPITFQGYRTTPGDEPPLLVKQSNPYAAFTSSDMPTFDGGNRTTGDGFNCENKKYLVFKNFQIKNYAIGFRAGGVNQNAGNLVLNNINIMSVGDIYDDYSGIGILLGSMGTKFSNNNTITNCQIVNAAAEGFGINGNYNTLTGCKVYCNEATTNYAATDYYIIVCGSYNTATSCYIERAPGLAHGGHGIGVKTNAYQVIDVPLRGINPIAAQYNKFYYCTAKNLDESFYVRHRTAQYNLFYHCKGIGTHTAVSESGGEGNCIMIRDGASDNTFDGCIAENCNSVILFADSQEDGDMVANPPGHPGNNNKIINGLFYNCYIGVEYNYDPEAGQSIQSDAGNNTIANCTFYKTQFMFYAARHCANMKYIGNIYYGCSPESPGYFKGGPLLPGSTTVYYSDDIIPNGINTYFKQCDFINIPSMPIGYVGINGNVARSK